MSVCIFVALYLCMLGCLLQEPRYYEFMFRNQWDLGIYLNMALVKVEQGHFETAILILHNFFVFYCGYRCLEALNKISSWFKRCEQWCSCLRVHILVWMLLQDISDRIRLSLSTDARIYELCFTCVKIEYKGRIFSKLFQWSNNWYLDMDFNSKVCAL